MSVPSLNKEISWLLREKYQGRLSREFAVDCSRLATGLPLAYIIGHQPFLGATIWLDSRPLIPRTETEYWVAQLIDDYHARGVDPVTILDLCSGSGCIGVALANAFPAAQVTFVELDPAHLSTIEKNCRYNEIPAERYRILGGDLFEPLSSNDHFALVVANPPYIDPVLDRTTDSVRRFEPALALYGGESGCGVIARLIADAAAHLKTSGELWLEHEPEQCAVLQSLAAVNGFVCHTHHDQFAVSRYSRLVLQ